MSRILIVSYRPAPGKFHEVVGLLRAQYQRSRALGMASTNRPLLARSAAGDLTLIATFSHADDLDRCWEDPDFQDLDARLAEVAEMIPARSLHEASGSYMDLEEIGADPKPSNADLSTLDATLERVS